MKPGTQLLLSFLLLASVSPIRLAEGTAAEPKDPFEQAQIVFTGVISEAVEGGQGKTCPPVRLYSLEITQITAIRGEVPAKLRAGYQIQSMFPPEFPGGPCTFAVRRDGDQWTILAMSPEPRLPKSRDDTVRARAEEAIRQQRTRPQQ